MRVTVIPIVIDALGTIPQGIGKGTGRLENKRLSGDHLDNSIVEIGQNTEKSSGDLRHAVTQTPVRNHQLMLEWKIQEGNNDTDWVKD